MTDAKASAESTVAKPVTAKQSGKKTEVNEAVVIKTNALDVAQPMLIEQAKDAFVAMVTDTYGPVEDVQFIKVNHHVGTSATYYFSATVGG